MTKKRTEAEQAVLDEALARALAEVEAARHAGEQSFLAPRFTLGAITSGLGIPEVTIRNWLTRNQIAFDGATSREKGKWRLFSVRDAIVLAVCFRLSRLGVPVSVFSKVYEPAVGLAKAMLSGPLGMARNPVGVLWNDGEWRLDKTFDSGPFSVTAPGAPAMAIIIDFEKIIVETMNALGMSAGRVSPDNGEA